MKHQPIVHSTRRSVGDLPYVLRLVMAPSLALATALLFSGAVRAASTTDFLLQPAEAGTKSLLSWSFGGDWLAPSNVVSGGGGMNYLGTFAGGAAAPGFVSGTFNVSGAGSYNNLTTGSNFQITQILFEKYNDSDLVISLKPSTFPVSGASQQMRYTPGTDSYLVDMPFSSFVSGTYAFNNGVTSPANVQTLTITAVPEPSTCVTALAGLPCGGFSMWRRRKRA